RHLLILIRRACSMWLYSCLPWIPSYHDQQFPRSDPSRKVELQKILGDSSFWCQKDDGCPFEPEVLCPGIGTRIEKTYQAAGFHINRRDVRSFMAVAKETRPGEVLGLCLAAVFPSDDVVRFVGSPRVFFVEQAILTPMASPLLDRGPQDGR